MTKNISITNPMVEQILKNSSNASKLIEEAIIFYLYAIENTLISGTEANRIIAQGLIQNKKRG